MVCPVSRVTRRSPTHPSTPATTPWPRPVGRPATPPTAWTCQNAAGDPVTVTDATVPIALGDHLTCTITNNDTAPEWTVAKSSDPASGSTVAPGSLITYTITATETGDIDPTGVVVTDTLTDVLANATLVDGSIDPSTGNADVMGDSLVWNIGTLTGAQTLSYTVRVNDDAFGVTLRNAITAIGSEPPDDCAAGIVPAAAARVGSAAEASDPCSTTHKTPQEPPPGPGPGPAPGTWTRTAQHRGAKRCSDHWRPVTRWHRDQPPPQVSSAESNLAKKTPGGPNPNHS